ncbi:MAG: nuclear transport factor 2 family protein [bacterium]|nr:nuclear transport factor 2 family protein [bacterium]
MKNIMKQYFDCWLNNNSEELFWIFADDVIYSECYGPEYHGINEVVQWFMDWNKKGKVLKWDIKQMLSAENKVVVEWYFECMYDNELSQFDGVTLAEFNEDNKIICLKEFESKHEHYYPYH